MNWEAVVIFLFGLEALQQQFPGPPRLLSLLCPYQVPTTRLILAPTEINLFPFFSQYSVGPGKILFYWNVIFQFARTVFLCTVFGYTLLGSQLPPGVVAPFPTAAASLKILLPLKCEYVKSQVWLISCHKVSQRRGQEFLNRTVEKGKDAYSRLQTCTCWGGWCRWWWGCRWLRTRSANHKSMWQRNGIWSLSLESEG